MDLRKIKKLIDLLEESNLAEIEIKEGEESVRLAGNTLLWEVDGVSFRFESALDRAAAVAVANSLD